MAFASVWSFKLDGFAHIAVLLGKFQKRLAGLHDRRTRDMAKHGLSTLFVTDMGIT